MNLGEEMRMTDALNDAHRTPETSPGDGIPDEPENGGGPQGSSTEAKTEALASDENENRAEAVSEVDGNGNTVIGRVVEAEALQTQLADVQAKAAEYLDGWQRARAEFANFRRRADKEREDIYDNATVDVLTKLLPVIDDFERALNIVPAERQNDDLIKGFGLIYRKLVSLLETAGVQAIDPKGQPFDPNYHEAVGRDDPSPAAPTGHVSYVMQKGYVHGNRIVRPALVRVAQ
jgi:molecular chaperone GrpE